MLKHVFINKPQHMTHIYTYWEGWILVNMYRTHLMREGGGTWGGVWGRVTLSFNRREVKRISFLFSLRTKQDRIIQKVCKLTFCLFMPIGRCLGIYVQFNKHLWKRKSSNLRVVKIVYFKIEISSFTERDIFMKRLQMRELHRIHS